MHMISTADKGDCAIPVRVRNLADNHARVRIDGQYPDHAPMRPRAHLMEICCQLRITRIVAAGRDHHDVGGLHSADDRPGGNAHARIPAASAQLRASANRDAVSDNGACARVCAV